MNLKTNLRMPAEWEPQSAIWCTWPDNKETWPENRLAAQIEFAAFVHSLAVFVPVNVMVNAESLGVAKRNLIRPDIDNVNLVDIPTNDAWARDYAPVFVINSESQLVALDWKFNSWGGKYPPYDFDQNVAKKIAEGHAIERLEPGPCFEGGAIETNGKGIVLSTSSCALDENRNPEIPSAVRLLRFEQAFQKYLGARETIWLSGTAIQGDDTDGHIDQLVRFTDPTTLVYAWTNDEDDPQRKGLEQNLFDLKKGLERIGEEFTLHPLNLPAPFEHCGRQIPASYCNFLITNDAVLVPQFSVPEDAEAIQLLQSLFPDSHVYGLPSRNLAVGLGSFHCLTQQVPALQSENETAP